MDEVLTGPPPVPGLVSTIIPVFNRPEMIRDAVASVLGQTYRPVEMILVDDGSTDGTPAVLEALAGAHPGLIRVVRTENGGPGLAREAGRLLARGEFIQYLDSDDLLLPGKFALQVQALRERPECGIAYGISLQLDLDTGRVDEAPSKWTGRRYERLFPALLLERWWHTHTPLYRRSLCDLIGPWPANRPEDWDYDARAGALRARLAYCPVPVSLHRVHQGERVSFDYSLKYLLQEAWFLPRLHACAVQAGVEAGAPEMELFSRWSFSLARRLGRMGAAASSPGLFDLARKSAAREDLMMKCTGVLAGMFGWRFVGGLGAGWDRVRNSFVGRRLFPPQRVIWGPLS